MPSSSGVDNMSNTATQRALYSLQPLCSRSIPIFKMTLQARDEKHAITTKPKAIQRAKSAQIKKIAVTSAASPGIRTLPKQTTAPSMHSTVHQAATRSILHPTNQHHDGGLQTSEYGTMIESADVVRLCMELGMTKQDVRQLQKGFNEEDCDHADAITLKSFFYLIHEERRVLTQALLHLAVQPGQPLPTRRLTFDEYLRCVVTFSSFTEGQVFHFFFQLYADITKQRTASTRTTIGEDELHQLSQDIQVLDAAFAHNIQVATSHLAPSPSSMMRVAMENWTFADFERFTRQHRVAFYPLIRIQSSVRHAGGHNSTYWEKRVRERQEALQLVTYMQRNHGRLPPVPWKDRIWSAVLHRPTTAKRIHERAKTLYTLSC